jgi:CheY-like chemotaxis protein
MDYHVGSPTVLVVEDDAGLRGLVIHMLANGGLTGLEADTADKALAMVQERDGRLDLAIIDMVMPGVSGLDLAAILGRDYPNLKILYISGYIGSLAAEALARRSPERVLLKPFTEEALLTRVRMLLGAAPAVSGGRMG